MTEITNYRREDLSNYGNGQSAKVVRTRLEEGLKTSQPETDYLHKPHLDEDAYKDNLKDIANSCRLIHDPQTGKCFEVAEVNRRIPAEEGVVAEIGSFTSSITGTKARAKDLAENGAVMADRKRRLYIAAPGNGGSSYFSQDEIAEAKRAGGFFEEVELAAGGTELTAMPTIQALGRAVAEECLDITAFSTNSAGGVMANALMSELPAGQVTHVYEKGRPTFENLSVGRVILAMAIQEDIIHSRIHRRNSKDPRKTSHWLLREVENELPNIYGGLADEHKEAINQIGTHSPKKIWEGATIFSRGATGRREHPVVRGVVSALKVQPDIKFTFQFSKWDPLYRTGTVNKFAAHIRRNHEARALIRDGSVEMLETNGTHADYYYYPAARWAVENYALNR